MKKIFIYIATGNKSKLQNFRLILSWIDPEIVVELVPYYIEIKEAGNTLADNSRLKVIPYLGKYEYPVIANDSGLFFDKQVEEIQDPIKVKRNALGEQDEDTLSQREIGRLMYEYYRLLAQKYGGKINCQMRDVFSILLPNGIINQRQTVRDYYLVDRKSSKYDIYHPLNTLRISRLTSKFMDQMNEEEDRIDKHVLVEALRELISVYSNIGTDYSKYDGILKN